MKRERIILVFVLLVVCLSGCGVKDGSQDGNYTPKYSDDALKIETEITGQVLPNQIINMKVRLTNQVENDVGNIVFKVTDFYGLKPVGQICGNGQAATGCPISTYSSCGCQFDSIQSLDEEEIVLSFRVPNSDEVAMIGRELKPEFTLTYNYFGEATLFVPILGANEKSTSAKLELVQTNGPIHVDIERGFTSSSKDWEMTNSQFSVILRVKDVVNSRNVLEITSGQFSMCLNDYLQKYTTSGRCDLNAGTAPCYNPDSNIQLPMTTPLVCSLQATNTVAPWVYGTVKVNYSYTYRVIKTQIINVETIIA